MCVFRWACRAWRATVRNIRMHGRPKALHDKPLFDPAAQMRRALKLLEICRRELGDEVELLHDMHER